MTLEHSHHLLRVLVEHCGSLVRTAGQDPGQVGGITEVVVKVVVKVAVIVIGKVIV